ncbi:MotA/TolQ/ExbB proton channel family protein [Marinobacter sp. 1-4A]|uniref:MotA/TolQ/ExbB proton channel family protein n=1 Tax=Marinobacter sp. 1-4A TaxID=2582919 RepID=UPI00190538D5|nr:MotA/TolQ/ExbB proton channel family protein [Marinobacter sp. 1-4A]MBK1850524.1 MotA/TolQ/ExbB proton channel family protein [Marinobacter sp. 1-4A]
MNPDIVTEEAGVMADIQGLLITGGPVVWILCVFSLIALTIVLVKVWQLVMLRAESSKVVSGALEQWRAGKGRDAVDQLDDAHPVAAVVKCAMVGRMDKVNDLLLREEVERIASARLNDLRSFFRPLELIGALSPLLGLLGTVMGMIVAFQQMEAAGSQVDPSVLSGGIWQALLTTAVGMAVAIPVVAAHAWLERKTERVAALMSDSVTRVFTSPMPASGSWPKTAAGAGDRNAA